MPITHVDHVYVETRSWEAAEAFWRGLGFAFAERWGEPGHRAGRLVCGTAAVVLAEVGADHRPAFNVFLGLDGADAYELPEEVDVETPLADTHWGTRWIRVRDPEGRVFCLEEEAGG